MANKKVNGNLKIVCLGGGIGTVNLIRGLKKYFSNITVVVSMADEGGSSGRLRRLYNIPPPGDLISCMAALSNEPIGKLLTYRFPGNRYAKDYYLEGHKLGNLMAVAARDSKGDFGKALNFLQKIFNIKGNLLPVSLDNVSISIKTIEGKIVHGEENIDLGKYKGEKNIDKVFLHPKMAKATNKVIESIKKADVIIIGPGDLYTTILPVLIFENLTKELKNSSAIKIFVANIANKPFQTIGYGLDDYLSSINKHVGKIFFDKILVNNNNSLEIPSVYKYEYLKHIDINNRQNVIERDLVNVGFPLYHDSKKLAKAVAENI